jgi:hypothetical protein
MVRRVPRPIWSLVLALALAAMPVPVGAATAPVYRQTQMMHCLVQRKLGFAYSFGVLPAIPLRQIPRDRDGAITGALVFQSFPLFPGKKIFGSGELVFMRSAAGARVEQTRLVKRFSFNYDRSQVRGNVVVLWASGLRSPLAQPTVLACFRASRAA